MFDKDHFIADCHAALNGDRAKAYSASDCDRRIARIVQSEIGAQGAPAQASQSLGRREGGRNAGMRLQ